MRQLHRGIKQEQKTFFIFGFCFVYLQTNNYIPSNLHIQHKSLNKSLKVEVSPWLSSEDAAMKPTLVADEMFPEGAGPYNDVEEAGGSVSFLMDLAANEKSVHADFFNDFEDLFDDDDLA